MLTIRQDQLAMFSRMNEPQVERRAVRHLQACIPEICEKLGDSGIREVVRWGRRRSRLYGIEREVDFFRYLNLMFMFGYEFDTDPRCPWAASALTAPGMHPRAKMDLVMDHALLSCSRMEASE